MKNVAFWALAAATLVAACDSPKLGGGGPDGGIGGKGGTTLPGAGTGGTSGSGSSAPTSFCSGKGPIVTVTDSTTSSSYQTCTGRIAETKFTNALCTCNDASVAGYLRTRSFDSAKQTSPDLGGSVGVNKTYIISAGYTDIGGSFAIAGADSLSFAGYLKTGGDFRSAGSALVAGYTNIGRNAWLASGMTGVGPVSVAGDLHSSRPIVAIPLSLGGTQYQEAIIVTPPCPCTDKDILDIAPLVADAKLHNDNLANGISPSMFNLVVGNVSATLPCGRFYIEQMGGIGNIIINVTGRVALFVDGSIATAGNLEFRLAADAEIDIFVRDNLALTGRATFGAKDRPARSRIYVGGDGDVMLVGDGQFVGNVYAPRSLVTAVGYVDVWGSVFARDFVSPGYANFTYDRAIQHAGDVCDPTTPPPGTCTQCGTCTDGTACVGGTCGACRTDADCCSLLVCSAGKCIEPGPTIY